MLDYVEPEGGSPVYYSKDLAFSRLAVDHLQTCTVLYLYLPDGDAVHKVVSSVSSSSTSGQSPYFSYYTVSVWKPFVGLPLAMPHDIPSTVWSLKFHSVNKKKWLYVTSDAAIVELNPDQCTLYKFCTDCVRDPYCGWNVAVNSCQSFTPGLLQSTSQSESLTVCQSSCVRKYVHASVVAGMSLHLSCSSNCHPDGDIRWMFSNNAAGISPRAVPVGTDADYVLSRDGGLVILVTKAAVHAGTFFCTYNDVVLAEHQVAMSGCEYGENVRDILTKEYVRWCKTFDSYNTEYQTWLCMKKKCLESNCVPNISECKWHSSFTRNVDGACPTSQQKIKWRSCQLYTSQCWHWQTMSSRVITSDAAVRVKMCVALHWPTELFLLALRHFDDAINDLMFIHCSPYCTSVFFKFHVT